MDHVGKALFCDFNGKGFDLAGPDGNDPVPDCRKREASNAIEETAHRDHIVRLSALSRRRSLNDGSRCADGGLGSVDRRHDVGVGGGVQTKGSCNSRHLSRGEHESKSKQSMVLKHHESCNQDCCLQECRET